VRYKYVPYQYTEYQYVLLCHNVPNWEHYLDDKLTAFPDVDQAIRNKTPFVLIKPTINDLFEDTMDSRLMTRPSSQIPVCPTFLKLLLLSRKMTRNVVMKKPRYATLSYLPSRRKPEMHIRSVPAFKKAVDGSDSYAMFTIAKEMMYSKDLKDAFPTYAIVLQDMKNCDLNRKKPAAKPESKETSPSRIDHPVSTIP
jgi:hypothetical protein